MPVVEILLRAICFASYRIRMGAETGIELIQKSRSVRYRFRWFSSEKYQSARTNADIARCRQTIEYDHEIPVADFIAVFNEMDPIGEAAVASVLRKETMAVASKNVYMFHAKTFLSGSPGGAATDHNMRVNARPVNAIRCHQELLPKERG